MAISAPKLVSHGGLPKEIEVVVTKPERIGVWGSGPWGSCTWGSGNPGSHTQIIVVKAMEGGVYPRRELETFTFEEAVATSVTFFFEIQPRSVGSQTEQYNSMTVIRPHNEIARCYWDQTSLFVQQTLRQLDIDFSDDSSTDPRDIGFIGTHPFVMDARRVPVDELPNRFLLFYVKVPGITAYRISDNNGATFRTEEVEVDTAIPAVLEAEAVFENQPASASDLRDVTVLQRRG